MTCPQLFPSKYRVKPKRKKNTRLVQYVFRLLTIRLHRFPHSPKTVKKRVKQSGNKCQRQHLKKILTGMTFITIIPVEQLQMQTIVKRNKGCTICSYIHFLPLSQKFQAREFQTLLFVQLTCINRRKNAIIRCSGPGTTSLFNQKTYFVTFQRQLCI